MGGGYDVSRSYAHLPSSENPFPKLKSLLLYFPGLSSFLPCEDCERTYLRKPKPFLYMKAASPSRVVVRIITVDTVSSNQLHLFLHNSALWHLRQIAHETSGEVVHSGGRQPAVLRIFSQRLSSGFNDAVNGFMDDGWSLMSSDGGDDVTIAINSSPSKLLDSPMNSSLLFSFGGGILCAKASMLLQLFLLQMVGEVWLSSLISKMTL